MLLVGRKILLCQVMYLLDPNTEGNHDCFFLGQCLKPGSLKKQVHFTGSKHCLEVPFLDYTDMSDHL